MVDKISMIRGLCENIIFLASIDEPITIDGNDVNSSEARPIAEKILQVLDLEESEVNKFSQFGQYLVYYVDLYEVETGYKSPSINELERWILKKIWD